MCVGFWSLQHPKYALILCTNRDEFLDRPTKGAAFHSFEHDMDSEAPEGKILSGRDIRAGGTWLGVTRTGKIALLTNITEPPPAGVMSSRGHLVSSFLLSDSSQSLEDEVDAILPRDTRFPGFNMLLLAPSPNSAPGSLVFDACFVTNNGAGGDIHGRALAEAERHCGGISNGTNGQDASEWPKVRLGKSHLDTLLSQDFQETGLAERLFEILAWRPTETPSQLRDTIHVEPIPIKPNIVLDDVPEMYGTRLSTILLVSRDGGVFFIERDIWKFDEQKNAVRADSQSQRVYRFAIERTTM